VLKDEIVRMYQEVADNPTGTYHFFHGHEAAELFGYSPDWLERAPASAVASFAGVGNPHERSDIQPGETVLDLGSGAGLDAIIASWRVGAKGKVIGVDLNPSMCLKVQALAAETGGRMECQVGRMEDIPVPTASVPQGVDAELGRSLRGQGRHDDRAEATRGHRGVLRRPPRVTPNVMPSSEWQGKPNRRFESLSLHHPPAT
jgi:SAM-dependent methyltransferase